MAHDMKGSKVRCTFCGGKFNFLNATQHVKSRAHLDALKKVESTRKKQKTK